MMENSAYLQNFYLSNFTGNLGLIDQINEALNNLKITEATDLLNNFIPNTTLEYNCFSYYNYFLKFLKGEVFTTSDLNGIYSLASKCPERDGEIIHPARSLYNYIMSSNDQFEFSCGGVQYERNVNKKNENKKLETNNKIIIYPNPSKGNFVVKFTNTNGGINNIKIFDLYGKLIHTETCIGGVRNITINKQLAKGIYSVQITNSATGKSETQKLIIE
jgi:hypothetical protein